MSQDPGKHAVASSEDAMSQEPGKHAMGDMETQGDSDALRLQEMGYIQELERNFSVWASLGIGFSFTNSRFGTSAALFTSINSGGPALLVYGIIMMAFIGAAVGVTLSELASALPNAGGQYYWAAVFGA